MMKSPSFTPALALRRLPGWMLKDLSLMVLETFLPRHDDYFIKKFRYLFIYSSGRFTVESQRSQYAFKVTTEKRLLLTCIGSV